MRSYHEQKTVTENKYDKETPLDNKGVEREASEIVALINQQKIIVKTISIEDGYHQHYVLNQLSNLTHRPIRHRYQWHQKNVCYDPRTTQLIERTVDSEVGNHIYLYGYDSKARSAYERHERVTYSRSIIPKRCTKKTSVTLLPPDAKIELDARSNPDKVGLLFNIDGCNLKNEKFVFPNMVNSHTGWWLISPSSYLPQRPRSIALNELRRILTASVDEKHILPPNELLVGLAQEAMVGICAIKDVLEARLAALELRQEVMKRFQKTLPIFIITQYGCVIYSSEKIVKDLLEIEFRDERRYQKLISHIELAVLMKEVNRSFFDLKKVLITQQYDVIRYNLLIFLNIYELAKMACLNKEFYQLVNEAGNDNIWRMAFSAWGKNKRQENTKNDVLFSRFDVVVCMEIYRYKKHHRNEMILTNYKDFIKNQPQRSYYLMHSSMGLEMLPPDEKRLTPNPNSRSLGIKIAHSFCGLVLGLFIGLFTSIITVLKTVGVLLLYGSVIPGIVLFHGLPTIPRAICNLSVFPLWSLFKSIEVGVKYGWNYGLTYLNVLAEAISLFQYELFNGHKISEPDKMDSWSLFKEYRGGFYWDYIYTKATSARTNLPEFIRKKRKEVDTVADKANRFESQISFFKPKNRRLAVTDQPQANANSVKTKI